MPKKIKLQQNIPALMCLNMYEIMIISWVQSRYSLNKNFSVGTSVSDFLKYFEIPPETWEYNTALQFVYNKISDASSMKFPNVITKIQNYGN